MLALPPHSCLTICTSVPEAVRTHLKMVTNRKKLTKTTVSAMFTGTDVVYKYMLADQIIAGNLSICGAKNDVVDMCLLVGKANKVFLFPCIVCVRIYFKR